jgi:hypothetical protein
VASSSGLRHQDRWFGTLDPEHKGNKILRNVFIYQSIWINIPDDLILAKIADLLMICCFTQFYLFRLHKGGDYLLT